MKRYKIGGVAGKFRLIHNAHLELFLNASQKVELLYIFICDNANLKRYLSVNQVIEVINYELTKRNINFKIVVLSDNELTMTPWDELLLQKVPNLEVMFDSKEAYGNQLIANEYLNLDISQNLSVSFLEKNFNHETLKHSVPTLTAKYLKENNES